MKRLAFLAVSAALLFSNSSAQEWVEIGPGSGSTPGIFKAEAHSSVSPTGRREGRPQLVGVDHGYPMLVFLSESQNNRNYVWSLMFNGTNWAPPAGTTTGQIYGGNGYDLIELGAAANDLGLSTAFISTLPQFLEQDAYAATWDDESGWSGPGGSLDDGGITGVMSFTELARNIATAMGPDGRPDVAYSLGPIKNRSIYVKSYAGETLGWVGLDDSATTPIATGNATTPISYEHPSMAFRLARPVVAYTRYERQLAETVRVQIFNPTLNEWQELNGSATDGIGDGRRPQVATIPNQTNFYVAWENRLNGELNVYEWSGSNWSSLGDPLEPWGFSRMATFDDRKPSNPDPALANFAMAVDLGNRPVVAFRAESPAGSGKFHIFASYRDRQNGWMPLGDPQNDIQGLSKLTYILPDARGHYNPSIYIPADNRPIVAWTFDGVSTEEGPIILARLFSESIPGFIVEVDQVIDRILGVIESNPVLDGVLDDNDDDIIDAADAASLRF